MTLVSILDTGVLELLGTAELHAFARGHVGIGERSVRKSAAGSSFGDTVRRSDLPTVCQSNRLAGEVVREVGERRLLDVKRDSVGTTTDLVGATAFHVTVGGRLVERSTVAENVGTCALLAVLSTGKDESSVVTELDALTSRHVGRSE